MSAARSASAELEARPAERLKVTVRGAVQGVGFRPFVYRLARELGLTGWVRNFPGGVEIEAEGDRAALDSFLLRLDRERPPRASLHGMECTVLDAAGYEDFSILPSRASGRREVFVLPDIAVCPECLQEVFDPGNRRFRYPFTNCTNCGPRYSIIEALPYDRAQTTMKKFVMCEACRAEYEDPSDRRFHAQPNACPDCGPHLELWDPRGKTLSVRDAALIRAAEAVRQGKIVAVKGLGGFHLMVDAANGPAVSRLRRLKRREEKPFAVMFPSYREASQCCEISEGEARALQSPESPILLLKARRTNCIAPEVAPGNPLIGALLPYTPLHHLLLSEIGGPVVATSGNLSEEPLCADEREAVERLGGIADFFLVHDRPIARPVDDSVVRWVAGRELVLRRARGYAPLPVAVPGSDGVLALGAHLKSAVALSVAGQAFVSPHIGDLESAATSRAFENTLSAFGRLYGARAGVLACDSHPDYFSTRYALRQKEAGTIRVQHHHAHVLSCLVENEVFDDALGVAWDGAGYGPDGTVWGGEFIEVNSSGFRRTGHFRLFRLLGGDKAAREPRRSALALLYELLGKEAFGRRDLAPVRAFSAVELRLMQGLLERGFRSPWTSSVGRLFDAAAALMDLRQISGFEGQAAQQLEFSLDGCRTDEAYPFGLAQDEKGEWGVDWRPLFERLTADVASGRPNPEISARFHNALAETIVAVARKSGLERVALSGGCFQNKYLCERTVARLREEGFRPYWHQRIPPNDGGIALGQIAAASWFAKEKKACA